jgi:molybdopterin converting factor small subunit
MTVVLIPSQLQSYTGGASRVQADGRTVMDLLRDLDRQFPGIRFRVVDEQDRVRQHMKIFIGPERVADLNTPMTAGCDLMLFGALSGG